ncbi:conserved hypothetical protein [Agrobacterium sp. NCPPB 925]|nr:conserved hypothetical protein [Agrobacterium sp. NCPPB 925]
MWNRILAKLKLWSEALLGIDDLQGDQLAGLQQRVRRLEQEMEKVLPPATAGDASKIERKLSLDRPDNKPW